MRSRLRDCGTYWNGVACGVGKRDSCLARSTGGEVSHDVDRVAVGAPPVVRDVHPDLAWTVEVVIREHDGGRVGRPSRWDVGGAPLAVHAERRAARPAHVPTKDDVGR